MHTQPQVKTLQKILTYHVVQGAAVFSKDLKNGENITTVEGQAVTVTIRRRPFQKSVVKINDAVVTQADIAASNGVVHIIDTVLMPPDMPGPGGKNIVALATATPDLSTLVTALKAADLISTLSGPGPFTVFAPSNEAFANLSAGVLTKLLKPRNKAQLVKLLEYHVVSGAAIEKSDLPKGATARVETVEGSSLEVFRACTDRKCGTASRAFINPKPDVAQCTQRLRPCYEAQVTSFDNNATNGVVHIIDAVLIPPDF
jgi:transforming growth factor-beta-induced protein